MGTNEWHQMSMGTNECSQPGSKSSWDSQDFGDISMVLKMAHVRKSTGPQWVNSNGQYYINIKKEYKGYWQKYFLCCENKANYEYVDIISRDMKIYVSIYIYIYIYIYKQN